MDTIFTLGDTPEGNVKINLDELYERKKQHDLNTVATYNRILNRIHGKIKVVSRQQVAIQCCWFVVPEMIIGVPKYDNINYDVYPCLTFDKYDSNKSKNIYSKHIIGITNQKIHKLAISPPNLWKYSSNNSIYIKKQTFINNLAFITYIDSPDEIPFLEKNIKLLINYLPFLIIMCRIYL